MLPTLYAAIPPSPPHRNEHRVVAPQASPPAGPACTEETPDCEALCNEGDARACHELGTGNAESGRTEDKVLALEFFKKACTGGHAPGCVSAGFVYESGDGVPRDPKRAHASYERGCTLGDRYACDYARQLEKPDIPLPETAAAPASDQSRARARVELEAECGRGDWIPCVILGRKWYTGLFFGAEGAKLAFTDAAHERTGLTGGWGAGVRVGVEFLHWIPLNIGFRIAPSGDDRPFSEDVFPCDRMTGSCSSVTQSEGTSVTGMTAHLETGLQHTFQLVRGIGVAPGALIGFNGITKDFDRTVADCDNCRVEHINLDGGLYVAGTVRVVLAALAPYVRYERYLGGDFRDTFSIGLDIGLWASALAP